MLEQYVRERRAERDILIMAHIVVGYPTIDASYRIVDSMVRAGVDLIELQIPFSEPIADGPVILAANQVALAGGVRVDQCVQVAGELAAAHPIPFVWMTYYNILVQRGIGRMCEEMAKLGIHGAIVPDLPPEEGAEYLEAMDEHGRDPIFIFSPNTPDERMREIAAHARGFVYCVARKGVTGAKTRFSETLDEYLARCRSATRLPLALGFGVESREDVDFLRGKVDIAVVGTQTLRVIREHGPDAAGELIASLRGG
jgi:tryptophan synthase alpha chain